MPELTPAGLKAIAAKDPLAADALVAPAMGWALLPAHCPDCGNPAWERDDVRRHAPPPYWSCPADAPDRWRWWGEMIEALCKAHHGIVFAHSQASQVPGGIIPDHWGISDYAGGVLLGELTEDDTSLPHALCLALAAAGKIEEKPDGE